MSMYAPTYTSLGGAMDAPVTPGFTPAGPSMLSAAERYADPRKTAQPATVEPEPGYAVDNKLANLKMLREGSAIPAFLIQELPQYKTRIQRAMRDGDEEAVRKDVGEVKAFVDAHANELQPWTRLENNGAWGRGIANDAMSLVDGSFWGRLTASVGGREPISVATFLDDTSDEAKQFRVGKLAKTYGISTDVARAMVDSDDPLHQIYKPYGTVLTLKPNSPDAALKLAAATPGYVAKLRSTEAFTSQYLPQFGNDTSTFADFLTRFDATFNTDGFESGDRFMKTVADGYLSEKAKGTAESAGDYFSRVRDLTDSLRAAMASAPEASTQENPVASRMRRHEANSLVVSYIKQMNALGGSVTSDGLTAASLKNAADRVAQASRDYGIDLRSGGANGVSDLVVGMALKSAGIAGADDKGVGQFLDGLQTSIDLLVGADGPVDSADKEDPGRAPLVELEGSLRKTIGRELWNLRMQSPDKSFGTESVQVLLSRALETPESKAKITDALSKTLTARFVDPAIGASVANELVDGFARGQSRTIIDILKTKTGMFDPVSKAPIIPEDVAVSPGAEFTAEDVAALAAAPNRVVKGATVGQSAVLSTFAKTRGLPADDLRRIESTLNLIETATKPVDDALKPAFNAVVTGEAMSYDSYEGLKRGVISGDADALVLAAMLCEKGQAVYRTPSSTMAAGAVIVPHPDPYRSRRGDLRDDLARAGVPIGKSGYLRSAFHYLALKGDGYKSSSLVSSGFLDPVNGTMSEKRVIVRMQDKSYADPTKNQDNPTPEQKAARRAYGSLMTRGTSVGAALDQYKGYLKQQGFTDDEINVASGRMGARLTAAYEKGGAYSVGRLMNQVTTHRTRYVPANARDTKGTAIPGVYSYDVVTPLDRQMTDEEYDEYLDQEGLKVRSMKVNGAPVRSNFDPNRFRDIDGKGTSMYRRQLQMQERARQMYLDSESRSAGKLAGANQSGGL